MKNQPKLSLRQGGYNTEKGYSFHVTNHGKAAYHVKLKIDSSFTNEIKIINNNQHLEFQKKLDRLLFIRGFKIDIYYKNIFEEQIIDKYFCKKENDHEAASITERED